MDNKEWLLFFFFLISFIQSLFGGIYWSTCYTSLAGMASVRLDETSFCHSEWVGDRPLVQTTPQSSVTALPAHLLTSLRLTL